MNDSVRENPMPGNTPEGRPVATVGIECPQCGTQLRLLRPATVHTPIACCICGATFYLQPIETAPLSEAAIAPRRPMNGQNRPMFRIVSPPGHRPGDRERRGPGDPPPGMTTPAPPSPSPGTRHAPGMPRPVELPDHLSRAFRTRWLESVLGASLVLLLVVGACAGGFVLIRSFSTSQAVAPSPDADDSADSTPVDGLTTASSGGSKSAAPVAPAKGAPKVLPRPEELVGTWESRVDDGSSSTFVFRSDGTVEVAQAGDPPPPPTSFNWFLIERRGGDMVLDIGNDFGQMGNARLTIRLTSEDAFTLIKFIRRGLLEPGGELRYVRIGPPTPANTAPVQPAAGATSFIGPPAKSE